MIHAIYGNLGLVRDVKAKQLLHNYGHEFCETLILVSIQIAILYFFDLIFVDIFLGS